MEGLLSKQVSRVSFGRSGARERGESGMASFGFSVHPSDRGGTPYCSGVNLLSSVITVD